MALTAGVISQSAVTSNSISVSSTAASGGTGPYTEAYYISTTSGFTPGSGNIVAGASGLAATIAGLIPGTSYFIKVVYTDVGASATITSNQLASVTLSPSLSPNQFQQSPFLGQLDQNFNYDTTSAQIDVSQVGALSAGAAVKIVPYALGVNSVLKVVGCAADSDQCVGFINYDIKTQAFVAGSPCQLSLGGNVMYLYATTAITQGLQVTLDLTTMGGVGALVVSSGHNIVGWAYDGASAPGQLIRVRLSTPNFLFA